MDILPNWHPLVVHFAIALLTTASVLFLGATAVARRPIAGSLTSAARWNLGLGLAAAIFALATGWYAYNTVTHDDAAHANMAVHMRWALATTAMFALTAAAALLDRKRAAGASVVVLVGLFVASVALARTGWLGSENVFRYGLGVRSLPNSGQHQHHHQHGDGERDHNQAAGDHHEHDVDDDAVDHEGHAPRLDGAK